MITSIILSEDDKKMLFELVEELLPGEYNHFIERTQFLTKTSLHGLIDNKEIHWFELVVNHLSRLVFVGENGDTVIYYLDSLFDYYYPEDKNCSLIKHLYLSHERIQKTQE